MRPAPVQVNWLAYPGTSGAPWIDAVLADAFVLPDALAPHFSERVVRLPRCFQPSDTARAIPPAPPRVDCGLPDDAVVYCCFNNSYKLNPRSVARALAVLRAVPDSVLWLLSGPGRADQRLRAFAQSQGVDPARLVFMAKQPHAEYLARLQQADLFLDTEPYNAHTTASDAIWAGCPVLTRPGDTFAARVAGSLNHHLGLPELNVDSDEAFVARAVALGRDHGARRALRERVARQRDASGLFDMRGFARDFARVVGGLAGR
jgi:predicted O-linked N-acetylglucosamine transferase (SPINDLY family)